MSRRDKPPVAQKVKRIRNARPTLGAFAGFRQSSQAVPAVQTSQIGGGRVRLIGRVVLQSRFSLFTHSTDQLAQVLADAVVAAVEFHAQRFGRVLCKRIVRLLGA